MTLHYCHMSNSASWPRLDFSPEERSLPTYFTVMKMYCGACPESQQMGYICWAGCQGSVLWWEIALQFLAIHWKHL